MTITYQSEVATGSFSGFAKLLLKWRGSVYKLLYKEMLLFSFCYALISVLYRTRLNEQQRRMFEQVALYCSHYIDLIPLSFVLGFYVTFVVQRWWTQFITIPFPDRLMNLITLYINGADERGRLIRRTLMRYWNLSFVLMMRSISVAVKKRFPTLGHLVEAGFMTDEEYEIYESTRVKINKFWIPMSWFIKILDQTRAEGRVQEGPPLKHIMEELNDTRNNLKLLWCHDWVTVPLVYTQVVTWATHLFFMISLVGRQYLDPARRYQGHEVDCYVPFFTLMQFLFYMGWLKVAEQLINPFGEDDDDIECNWLIDRHLQVSYLGVDELYTKVPTLQKDMYWDDRQPDVPYTEDTLVHKIPYYAGSTTHIKVDERKQSLIHQPLTPATNGQPLDHLRSERCCSCFCRPKKTASPSGPIGFVENDSFSNGKSHPLTQRTLGRRETLMAEEVLAMLNMGRNLQDMFKERLNEHIETLAANDCTVEIDGDESGKSGSYVLKESMTTGRFIISRANSNGSVKSGKADSCAYINPVALAEALTEICDGGLQSVQDAPEIRPGASETFKARETAALSSVTEVDEAEVESGNGPDLEQDKSADAHIASDIRADV